MPNDVDRSKAESFYYAAPPEVRNFLETDKDPILYDLDRQRLYGSGIEAKFVREGGRWHNNANLELRPTDPDPGLVKGLKRVMHAIHLALYRDQALKNKADFSFERDYNINYAFVGGAAVQVYRTDYYSSPGRFITTGLNIVVPKDEEFRRVATNRLTHPTYLRYYLHPDVEGPQRSSTHDTGTDFHVSIKEVKTSEIERDCNAPGYRCYFECFLERTNERKLFYTPLSIHWSRFNRQAGQHGKQPSLFQMLEEYNWKNNLFAPEFNQRTSVVTEALSEPDFEVKAMSVQVLEPWMLLVFKIHAFFARTDVAESSLPLDAKERNPDQPFSFNWQEFTKQQQRNDAIDIWFLLNYIREKGQKNTGVPLEPRGHYVPRIPSRYIFKFHKYCDLRLRKQTVSESEWLNSSHNLKGRAYLWLNISYIFEKEQFYPYVRRIQTIQADGTRRPTYIKPDFILDPEKLRKRRDSASSAASSRRGSVSSTGSGSGSVDHYYSGYSRGRATSIRPGESVTSRRSSVSSVHSLNTQPWPAKPNPKNPDPASK